MYLTKAQTVQGGAPTPSMNIALVIYKIQINIKGNNPVASICMKGTNPIIEVCDKGTNPVLSLFIKVTTQQSSFDEYQPSHKCIKLGHKSFGEGHQPLKGSEYSIGYVFYRKLLLLLKG